MTFRTTMTLPESHPFIRRVTLKNYKSIAGCSIELRQLTFLVGPNGAGKSNFVDALRFVTDSLRASLDHALRDRGGIQEVRRRSGGHPTHFGIRIDFELPTGQEGHYAFRVGARPRGGFEVQEEQCEVKRHTSQQGAYFSVRDGRLTSSLQVAPALSRDRLYLVNVSGLPEFRPVYESLSAMGFYNLNPDRIRELQAPDPGELLLRDGSNLASVIEHLSLHSPSTKGRIEEYLSKVVPGVYGVDRRQLGPKETLEFRQAVAGAKTPWRFSATNMSDGTLRALGILAAIFQGANGTRVPLVAIEEPEVALHPAAAGVLLDGLRDASQFTQLVVTSHSPDLLDDENIDPEWLLAVSAREGSTVIGGLDAAGASALRDRLYTPGELLRMNQLSPDAALGPNGSGTQPDLFDLVGENQ